MDSTLPHIVCHLHTQRCSYCHAEQTYSNVYLCETTMLGNKARTLKPLTSPLEGSGLPAVIVTMPPKTTAYCHICIAGRPQPDANVHTAWQQTLARKRAEAAIHEVHAVNMTIDDLD